MADKSTIVKPSQAELKTIIQGDDVQSAELIVRWGERLGQGLAKVLKSAQIRNIFGKVRQIEMRWDVNSAGSHRELILLKPKLKYQAERKPEVEELADVLSQAIDLVKDRETFQRFVDFFEAILAYHKAHGGS